MEKMLLERREWVNEQRGVFGKPPEDVKGFYERMKTETPMSPEEEAAAKAEEEEPAVVKRKRKRKLRKKLRARRERRVRMTVMHLKPSILDHLKLCRGLMSNMKISTRTGIREMSPKTTSKNMMLT